MAKVVPTPVNPPPSQGDRVYAVDLLLRNCRKIEIPRRSVVFAKIPTSYGQRMLTTGNPFIAAVEIEVDNCTICLTELDAVQCEADG